MANNNTVTTRKRNLVAKDLRTPKYRMRVEVSAKKYANFIISCANLGKAENASVAAKSWVKTGYRLNIRSKHQLSCRCVRLDQ